MSKQEFLSLLHQYLHKLPAQEKDDIIRDYEEHFLFATEEGKTEQEIVQTLGSPKQIAKEILAIHHVENMENSHSPRSLFKAITAVIGLSFINLVLVLGPLLGIAGLAFGGWVMGLSFTISPVLFLISTLYHGTFEWFELFASLALAGAGIFILFGMYYVSIWLMKIFVKYLKFNVSVVKGGTNHA